MSTALESLIHILQAKQISPTLFEAQNEDLGLKSIFGGQVCGQALMSAYQTVEQRVAHSMHGYFIRPGDYTRPIQYQVDNIRDGNSFSVRRVIARQEEKEIFTMTASFQQEEDGLTHQFDMPDAADPEVLLSELEMRRRFKHLIPDKMRDTFTRERPIEIRPINPVNYAKPDIRPPYKQNWFRAINEVSNDIALQHSLLAYASDFALLSTSLLPHGVSFVQKEMRIASLDHAIWFHRPFNIAEWLLYDMDSPSSSGARGYSRGNIFNQDGQLVASVAQEALIRRIAPKH